MCRALRDPLSLCRLKATVSRGGTYEPGGGRCLCGERAAGSTLETGHPRHHVPRSTCGIRAARDGAWHNSVARNVLAREVIVDGSAQAEADSAPPARDDQPTATTSHFASLDEGGRRAGSFYRRFGSKLGTQIDTTPSARIAAAVVRHDRSPSRKSPIGALTEQAQSEPRRIIGAGSLRLRRAGSGGFSRRREPEGCYPRRTPQNSGYIAFTMSLMSERNAVG